MGSRRPPEHPDRVPREDGLRTIAIRAARYSPVAQIQHAIERPDADSGAGAVRRLVEGIESLPVPGADERAEAFWRLVKEAMAGIGAREHSMRRVALHAAFVLGDERQPNLGRRLERARVTGRFGDAELIGRDRPRQWWTDAVIDLAKAVDARMTALVANPSDWADFLPDGAPTPPTTAAEALVPPQVMLPVPADAQPVFVERQVATYYMQGRAVQRSTSERRVRAVQDGVEGYIVRTYDPVREPNPATVRALLNCSGGPVRSIRDGRGGHIYERSIFFPKPLERDEQVTFASEVVHEGADEALMVEIQVTSHGIAANGLTMRVQFAEGEHPAVAWWFADVIDAQRLDKPAEKSGRLLLVTRFGFLEHTFPEVCRSRAKYGLAWEW